MIKSEYATMDVPIEIVSFFGTIVVYSALKHIVKEISLYRHSNMDKIQEIRLKPEVKQKSNEVDIERFHPKDRRAVRYFVKKMKEIYPESNLKYFYNNLRDLEVYVNLAAPIIGHAGGYEPKKNIIYLSEKTYKTSDQEVYLHELLHMASSVVDNGIMYCGFSQKILHKPGLIGIGLTEGYTELLTTRIYGEEHTNAYKNEVEIARNVERLIGKEQMEELYFNADLPGLIEELKKYTDEKEILKFIKRVDFIIKFDTKARSYSKHQRRLIKESYREIYKFLLRTYAKSQEKLYLEDKISKREYIDSIAEYIYSLKLDKYQGNTAIINSKERNNIIKCTLNDELDSKVHQKLYTIHMANSN